MTTAPIEHAFAVGEVTVGALEQAPAGAVARLVLAHGAGTDMRHAAMQALADALAARGIATLRFDFPFRARGSARVDAPAVAHAAVRAALAQARTLVPTLPLFAGGRSFGGRMTTQVLAAHDEADVRGIVLFGFPLHAAGKPDSARAAHLAQVRAPMLLLQGERDALATLALLQPVVDGLRERATLAVFAHADHSLRVPARSGTTNDAVLQAVADAAAQWMRARMG